MTEIYASNPHAFRGNMDRLQTGAVLTLPSGMLMASATPPQQPASSHTESPPPGAQSAPPFSSGIETLIVEPGDTLSDIAASVKPDGTSTWQMMHQLYTANPDAFGQNIDVLYAGASLVIPDVSTPAASEATFVAQASYVSVESPAPGLGSDASGSVNRSRSTGSRAMISALELANSRGELIASTAIRRSSRK